MGSRGKRAGSRRASKRAPSFSPSLLLLAVGVTVSVVAWGYLVYAAIDFGSTARSGDSRAWWFLGLASAGAVACLFAGLMLVTRLLRRLGITHDAPPPGAPRVDAAPLAPPGPSAPPAPPQVRTPGGRRAAR